MTFYQELQLSSTGSKQLIRNTTDKKEKRRHILIYNFKVYLVMAFCVAVVTLYSKITGNANSVVGVTVLLAVLVLRQADFGIRTSHGLLSIAAKDRSLDPSSTRISSNSSFIVSRNTFSRRVYSSCSVCSELYTGTTTEYKHISFFLSFVSIDTYRLILSFSFPVVNRYIVQTFSCINLPDDIY